MLSYGFVTTVQATTSMPCLCPNPLKSDYKAITVITILKMSLEAAHRREQEQWLQFVSALSCPPFATAGELAMWLQYLSQCWQQGKHLLL